MLFFHFIFTALTLLSCIREVLLTKVIELPGFPTKVKFLHKSGKLHILKQHFIDKKAYKNKNQQLIQCKVKVMRTCTSFLAYKLVTLLKFHVQVLGAFVCHRIWKNGKNL